MKSPTFDAKSHKTEGENTIKIELFSENFLKVRQILKGKKWKEKKFKIKQGLSFSDKYF